MWRENFVANKQETKWPHPSLIDITDPPGYEHVCTAICLVLCTGCAEKANVVLDPEPEQAIILQASAELSTLTQVSSAVTTATVFIYLRNLI
jgi:hypothetical protein